MAEPAQKPSGKGALVSTLASVASLVAALSCCLPLGTLLLTAGTAGAALFTDKLRRWFLLASVACLVLAFVETYVRKRCEFRHRRLRTFLLWFSAAAVIGMLAAPRAVATLLAGRLPALRATSELYTFDAADFTRRFDAASSNTRLVVFFSPT